MQVRFSVVITARMNCPKLARCLASVHRQIASVGLETIVIKNNSFPDRLAGAKNATGEYVLFLDSDCELPDSQFITRLDSHLRKFPNTDVAGGHYLNSRKPHYGERAYHELCRRWITSAVSPDNSAWHLLGGCLLVRRSIIPAQMDLAKWGGEDALLVSTLIIQGATSRYWPNLSVRHHPDTSWRRTLQRAWHHGRAKAELPMKKPACHLGHWLAPSAWPYWPAWAVHVLALVLGLLIHRATWVVAPRTSPHSSPLT